MIARLTRPSIARAAVLPVAGMLAAIAGLSVIALVSSNLAKTDANLLEKANLTARVIAPNAAAAVWNFDTRYGAGILQSLGSDPDFGSGIVVDDKGELFASFRNPAVSIEAVTPKAMAELLGVTDPKRLKVAELREFVRDNEAIVVLPLEENGRRNVGYMALSFSRQRANAAALREIYSTGAGGILALLAVCGLLAWILSRVTRPIREITEAMDGLSAGEFDTAIPALERRDEIGAMARALAVFKENSIERERLEFLTRRLQETQAQLVAAARQAGMAQIANNVLHNVGNVLNSVNISAGVVTGRIRDSKAKGLTRAVGLINDHAADLGDFLTNDEKGKLLPGYLNKLVAAIAEEQRCVIEELGSLITSVDHIKDIVAKQQCHAGVASLVEAVQIQDLLEDALRIDAGSLARHQVTVVKQYADVPMLPLDKHLVLQVLVNLIGNAKQAMGDAIDRPHQLTLRVDVADHVDGRSLRICVEDDGEGIAPENLSRLFAHGFTTRKNGHGFGLHSCALAAKEMGGTLTARSEGPGKGAVFMLELPIKSAGDIAPIAPIASKPPQRGLGGAAASEREPYAVTSAVARA
jgi:signal transduction histidine kinase